MALHHSSYDTIFAFSIAERDCIKVDRYYKYIGKVSKTKTGIPCQRWDSQTPHKHKFNRTRSKIFQFPDKRLEDASNFCRNPDIGFSAWCYTTSPSVRYDFCNVPACKGLFVGMYLKEIRQ